MDSYNLTYKQYGERAILIEWSTKIEENILKDIINYKNKIVYYNIKVIVEVINTYNSLTIIYSSTIDNIYNEITTLKSIYQESFEQNLLKNYYWNIPVCYDEKFGLDLQEISKSNQVPIDEIIELHSGAIYTVFFIGFLPGFLYLGGLPERLNFARRSVPRLIVEKGAVGIGGSQTGVYPMQSAGGWNIIGNTPISLFNVSKENPCFAKSGDKIKFVPVSLEEYKQVEAKIEIGFYNIENKLIHD